MHIRSDDYLTSWFAYNTHFLFLFCCKASLYFCSYLQEKNSCPSFDYLTPLLLTCAEESLYYDEVAMLFTRLQTECKDFLACLKQQKAPLENLYPPGWVLPQHREFVISREELFFIFIFSTVTGNFISLYVYLLFSLQLQLLCAICIVYNSEINTVNDGQINFMYSCNSHT